MGPALSPRRARATANRDGQGGRAKPRGAAVERTRCVGAGHRRPDDASLRAARQRAAGEGVRSRRPAAPVTAAFTPARLGPLTLRNRIIKAATFEARTRRGEVTDALIEFHAAVARGGAAMTTVAYCAVSPDG